MLIAPPPPAPVVAPTAPTVTLAPCTYKHSRNAGGFVYATCMLSAQNLPASGTVTVHYKSNLATFIPRTNGTFRNGSGTLAFSGGGDQLQGLKLAFRGRTLAQVRSTLKVTLSNPTGDATIAAPASA